MRERARKRYHAVSFGGLLRRITQDGIIQIERLCETDVSARAVCGIATGGEIGGVKFLQLFAVRTERLALLCSAPGKCLWKPGNHHRLLVLEIGELVGFSIATSQCEVRSCVANFQISSTEESSEKSSHKSKNLLCHNVLLPLCQLP